jgi:hypothetical protein
VSTQSVDLPGRESCEREGISVRHFGVAFAGIGGGLSELVYAGEDDVVGGRSYVWGILNRTEIQAQERYGERFHAEDDTRLQVNGAFSCEELYDSTYLSTAEPTTLSPQGSRISFSLVTEPNFLSYSRTISDFLFMVDHFPLCAFHDPTI